MHSQWGAFKAAAGVELVMKEPERQKKKVGPHRRTTTVGTSSPGVVAWAQQMIGSPTATMPWRDTVAGMCTAPAFLAAVSAAFPPCHRLEKPVVTTSQLAFASFKVRDCRLPASRCIPMLMTAKDLFLVIALQESIPA
jgi:hypothetical protein